MILLIAEKVEPFLWNNTQGQWEEAALEKGGVDNRWAALAVSNTGDVVLFLKAATGSHVPRSRSLRLPQHRKDFRSRAVLSEDLQQRFGGTRPFPSPITRPRPLAGHSYREGNGADPPHSTPPRSGLTRWSARRTSVQGPGRSRPPDALGKRGEAK